MGIVTFGEIMLRLSPSPFLRFAQANAFDIGFGGGEANVAVSLANWGVSVELVTSLPMNDLGNTCLNYLRQKNVGIHHIIRDNGRIGIYFMEYGVAQRPSKVIYDRKDSSFARMEKGNIDWASLFKQNKWFHWTGITPALSKEAYLELKEALKIAKENNVVISCDLNYRKNLWDWGATAEEIMPDLVKQCSVLIGNEEDAAKVLNISAQNTDITAGNLDAREYRYVVNEISQKFPNLSYIAITLRSSISASHNIWEAVLGYKDLFVKSPKYEIDLIVDRVGSGDAFGAALIYALQEFPDDLQKVLNFAVAASALKHTISGDVNLVSLDEIYHLMDGDGSGRIER
jgi:2-dehydro-3-deoxygluconokinase